jgi:hypothetical protein
MSRVLALVQGIVTTVAAVPGVKSADWQLGSFALDDVLRLVKGAPYVRIGVLAAPVNRIADGNVQVMCQVGAFIVTEGAEARRDHQAWTIAEAIAVLACQQVQRWGVAGGLGAPTEVRIQPLTSSGADAKGLSLIAVHWRQALHHVGAGAFDADPPAPDTLIIGDGDEPDFEPEVSP